MGKAAGIFGYTVLVLLMAAAALTFLSPHFGWRVDVVFSGSMDPHLKTGGVVVTRPVAANSIEVGDIITFNSPETEKLTSHRVIDIKSSGPLSFKTKGDANEEADPMIVPAESVVGSVFFHVPYLGHITQFVKTPLGLLLSLCLPGAIIVIMEMRNIWRVMVEREISKNMDKASQ